MRRSTANGYHSDNSLGSFCPLPDVDDDEARAPPTVALPSRKKQKVDARALRKRQDENLRKVKDNYLREEQLQTENERLKDRLRELEGTPRDNTARTRNLEETCARQQAVIDTQALGSAYWADKVQWKKALSASADGGGSSVDDDDSAASRQRAPGPSQGQPRPGRPGRPPTKTEPQATLKRQLPADVMDLDRLTIHDKHPLLESMERINSTLGKCIDEMSAIQHQRLTRPHRDYRALCTVHYDVTLQIRQLERLCAKATP